jgi:hypothetical protein
MNSSLIEIYYLVCEKVCREVQDDKKTDQTRETIVTTVR